MDEDDLVPPTKLGIAITPGQEETLLQALAVKAGQRFQNMAEFQEAWRKENAKGQQHPTASQMEEPPVIIAPSSVVKKGSLSKSWLIPSVTGLTVMFGLAGYVIFKSEPDIPVSIPSDTSPHQTPRAPPSTVAPIPTQQPLRTTALLTMDDGVEAYNRGDYDQELVSDAFLNQGRLLFLSSAGSSAILSTMLGFTTSFQ